MPPPQLSALSRPKWVHITMGAILIAMAVALKAYLLLSGMERGPVPQAAELLARLRDLKLNDRERRHAAVIACLIDGAFNRASERLEDIRVALAEHIGARHSEIGRARLDVDRHVPRLHDQEFDPRIAGGDQQAAARVRLGLGSREAESLDRRLVESPLGQRDPEAAHTGTSAIASRSRETPTAGIGRPNSAMSSSYRPPAPAARPAPET